MQTPENRKNAIYKQCQEVAFVCDYERCSTLEEVALIMDTINRCQYQLVSVTQDSKDIYTVFFRRCVFG